MKTKIKNLFSGGDSERKMALDMVESGSDDPESYGKEKRVDNKLPSGVTSTMLYSDIIGIAWPSFVEFTLTQLTSMVDMMMVGGLGPWAITAVGLTTQPKFLMMTMFMAMNVGATALVARYKGEDSPEKANIILNQAILLTFILSILGSIAGYIYSRAMVRFMGAADLQTLEGGTVYLKIQMAGFVPMALTTTITATLRGVGNSKTAMRYNLVANLVNVIFNYLLIHGHFGFPKLGIVGASLATVLGQLVAFILGLIVILKGDQYLQLRIKDGFKLRWNYLKSIFNIGIPSMFEQLIMRAGMIIFSKTVASLGTLAFATHQICMNIRSLSFMTGQAFAVSATSLTGQSLGKRRPDMAQAYGRRTRRIGMIISVSLGTVFFFYGKKIVGLYTDDLNVIEQGAKILKLVALIQPFQSSQFILTGALRGAGDTRATAVIMFFTVLLIRPGLAILTIRFLNWGIEGAWIAIVVDQIVRSVFIVLRYRSGKWKSIKV